MAYMSVLMISGKEMPKVKSITISREPIWSKNAGRSADGTMLGDIVAQKLKLEIVFSPMSDANAAILDAAITPAFFVAKFRNPGTGKTEEHTMYSSGPKYPVYSYVDGFPRYVGVGVSLIEQ